MRLDYVTIFPDYFEPARALARRARRATSGLLELHVHDLRQWTHDRHRTVDDTPYGGGAGMVMRPEPWGEALDELLPDGATLVVPTPSGTPFTQAVARELAGRDRLVFACGRYEGIDQRVLDHAAARAEVREISVGDYVLNGGEVAALAITEAVVRLLPGFMGNAESLVEESHEDGLLEYPVYTKPAVVARPRRPRRAALRRPRPDRRVAPRPGGTPYGRAPARPAPAERGAGRWRADRGGAGRRRRALTLQRACWVQEMHDNPGVEIPALHETLDDVRAWLPEWTVLVLRREGRLVGAVRARREGDAWDIGRLMVAPDLQGQGLGRFLLARDRGERRRPTSTSYSLFTGAGSVRNQRMYKQAGYRLRGELEPGVVVLTKPRRPGGRGGRSATVSRHRFGHAPLWQTRSSARRPKDRVRGTPGGLRRAPATGGTARRRPP